MHSADPISSSFVYFSFLRFQGWVTPPMQASITCPKEGYSGLPFSIKIVKSYGESSW